jgi:hypothetical protein
MLSHAIWQRCQGKKEACLHGQGAVTFWSLLWGTHDGGGVLHDIRM